MTRRLESGAPEIDFALPQPEFDRSQPWLGWALLALALALAFALAADHAQQLGRRDRAEAALRQARAQQPRDAAAAPAALAAEMRFAGEALAVGRIPWEAVFREVEAAMAPEIALLGMNPRGARQEMQVTGDASDVDALAAFMRRVGAGGLHDVRLLGHQPVLREGRELLRFELVVRWRAA